MLDYITGILLHLGYWGVFGGMFLQSTFIPFPSEVVMIPAGIAIRDGNMNFAMVLVMAVTGNTLGAMLNYVLAFYLGRPLVLKYGKYVGFTEGKLAQAEKFFAKYGSMSMLLGRLIPVLRQLISLPAGLAKMNFSLFTIFIAIGSALWILMLLLAGYLIGANRELLTQYIFVVGGLCTVGVIIFAYCYYRRRQTKPTNK